MNVPFFRPSIGQAEIDEVAHCLRSGWLTTGPTTRRFEAAFAAAVGAKHAVAVNSCTAALHLAVEALGLTRGQAVLVPTMTFAATAEIVRYQQALPILVDCDPLTFNMDLRDAARKIDLVRSGALAAAHGEPCKVIGMIPVHVSGLMMDMAAVHAFAKPHGLWVVEDAAHAFPAAWRAGPGEPWQHCGQATSKVSCFSFYANKTITTGEGGMAVTDDAALGDRMRMMSLHGLSHDAWGRYTGGKAWDYRIVEAGYKYNLTDIAAAVGVHQLERAEAMRVERESIARSYLEELADVTEIELPVVPQDRIHAWHLFPIRLQLDRLSIDRNEFIVKLKAAGVGCSVHWRPLHLHPYYSERFGWKPEDFPVASPLWERLVSLPLFPGIHDSERAHVVQVVRELRATSRMISTRVPIMEPDFPASPAAIRPSAWRAALGYAALALPALAILLDTAVAVARGWPLESRLDRAALAAVGLWLLAVTGLLALRAGRSFYTRRSAQLVLLSISMCATCAVAELALGPILANLSEPFHCRRPGLTFIYHPQPGIMRDVGPEAHVALNAWGVRGDDPPPRAAASRILCLGGSSTACTYLDDTRAWPHLLQTELAAADASGRIWVGNAGLPGFRTAEHRQFVEQSSIVPQVDCLVIQTGINDFMACLAGPRPSPPLWSNSRVWQLARTLSRRIASDDVVVEDSAGTVYVRRRAIRARAKIDDDAPALDACLDDFAQNLRAIIDECRRRQLRLVFTTQSVLWRADLDAPNKDLLWFGELSDGRFLSVEQLRAGMDRYNDTLRGVCHEQGAELIDLSNLNGDPTVFYDDCHFTETGAARVARLVAEWFENHPISRPWEAAPR